MSIIAIDLDGTLLTTNHEISQENIEAIKQAQKSGNKVVIATGRAHEDARQIIKQTGLSLPIISANGATIHSPEGTELFSSVISSKEADRIIPWLEKNNYYYELTCKNGIYTQKTGKEILEQEMKEISEEKHPLIQYAYDTQMTQAGVVQFDTYQTIHEDERRIYKIFILTFDEEKRRVGWERLSEMSELTIVYSSKYNLELHNPESSKGKALQYISKLLDSDLDVSMAVGDSGNDLSMFEVVSNSYAMENADDTIKSHTTSTTTTNETHGVAKAIEEFLGKR